MANNEERSQRLPETDRVEGREEVAGYDDGCAADGPCEECSDGQGGEETDDQEKEAYVIYSLLDVDGSVFYVGKTRRRESRMYDHRRRFGDDIRMGILQDDFSNETPGDAEKRWIKHYAAIIPPDKFANFVHSGKRQDLAALPSGTRVTVSVRNVDAELWTSFREAAGQSGYLLYRVFGEALHDWLKKHDR